MIIQSDNVFGAIAYTLTKSKGAPLYTKLDDATKRKYQALSPFFLSFIGGGDLTRHGVAKVADAMQKQSPDILAGDAAVRVASAFLDVAATITDNVY
jgi:hypothetical protein